MVHSFSLTSLDRGLCLGIVGKAIKFMPDLQKQIFELQGVERVHELFAASQDWNFKNKALVFYGGLLRGSSALGAEEGESNMAYLS
jgi:hypothetical protein